MVEVKKEIIWQHEQGMQVAANTRFYKKSTSVISERSTKGARCSKTMATYSGRCRKVAFGVDK
jgi:hypothetical protein